MSIQELVKQAIERIDSMSIDELRTKFLEHGYVPASQKSHLSYSLAVQGDVSMHLNAAERPFIPRHEIAQTQVNYSVFAHSYTPVALSAFELPSTHKIAANQEIYSILNSCDFDIAA